MTACSIKGCKNPRKRRAWCDAHYTRWLRHGDPLGGRFALELAGKRFGRLLVIRRVGKNADRAVLWLCKCDCGATTNKSGAALNIGRVLSCGCRQRETGAENSVASACKRTVHGHTNSYRKSREYTSWQAMKDRCTNANNSDYKYYGERGITVCKRWTRSFKAFLADMGPRPNGTTLDRYPDNNGNYEPGNCRWATSKQQYANQRIPQSRRKASPEPMGVRREPSGKYEARFRNKRIALFSTAQEASDVYQLVRAEYYSQMMKPK